VLGAALLVWVGGLMIGVQREKRAEAAALDRERIGAVTQGQGLVDLAGTDLEGRHARYAVDGGAIGSFVIAMSVDCGFCDQNLAAWRRLSQKARHSGLQVVWVSRDRFAAVDRMAGLDESLIVDPTHSTFLQLKLSTVPQTLLVEKNGKVAIALAGTISPVEEEDLAREITAAGTRDAR